MKTHTVSPLNPPTSADTKTLTDKRGTFPPAKELHAFATTSRDARTLADEFMVWDAGTTLDTMDLFNVARKAWSLTDAEADALVIELDARGIV